MIVIEGADCTGKTTLCKKLSEALKLPYRHMSKPADDFDHVAGYMQLVGAHVQDRYHLGAVVYGQMLGAGGAPSAQQMQLVQRYLRWQGCVVVILHCQRARLSELLDQSSSKEMYQRDQILCANDGFIALTKCTNRGEPWCDIHIDVTDRFPDIDDHVVQEIMEGWRYRWQR